MNCKVFVSDEGFGPIVRQSAVIHALREKNTSITFTLQTGKHFEVLKNIIPDINYSTKHNNIEWSKNPDGSPDVDSIASYFKDYISRSDGFIEEEKLECNFDFFISDFVFESFEIAQKMKIPSFGVTHFTWDWFFSKLYPPPLHSNVLQRFHDYIFKADVIYFPPFTPKEILRFLKSKAKEVPFVVRKDVNHKQLQKDQKFKVLLIDSGSNVLQNSIQKALDQISVLDDFHFYVSSNFRSDNKNVTLINKNELLVDYISQMDLVIGRAGFNTISECIAFRTPMLLLSEAMNPEMSENLVNVKHEGLGSFISLDQFTNHLGKFLPRFVKHEYNVIDENIKSHDHRTDGAEVIADDILNFLG